MRKCRLVVRVKELCLLTLPFLPRTKSKIRLGTQREDQTGHSNTISVKQASCLLTYRGQCGTRREGKGWAKEGVSNKIGGALWGPLDCGWGSKDGGGGRV